MALARQGDGTARVGTGSLQMLSQNLQLAAILVYPACLSSRMAYFAWAELRRPWQYLLVATAAIYAIYGLTFTFIGGASGILLAAAQGDPIRVSTTGFTGLVLFKLCAKPLLGFSVMALPILTGIYVTYRRTQ